MTYSRSILHQKVGMYTRRIGKRNDTSKETATRSHAHTGEIYIICVCELFCRFHVPLTDFECLGVQTHGFLTIKIPICVPPASSLGRYMHSPCFSKSHVVCRSISSWRIDSVHQQIREFRCSLLQAMKNVISKPECHLAGSR